MARKRAARPLSVGRPRPWATIAAFAVVGTFTAGIIGYGVYASSLADRPWTDKLAAIDGITDYVAQKPAWLTQQHKPGSLPYEVTPSVGGDHNGAWQNCSGTVYDAPIATEHATHSLEHGAVWVTYRPGLDAGQVRKLADRVQGRDYTLMSPHDQLTSNVTVQAWGYQLAVDSADDARIDTFISAARVKAGPEQGAPCSGGNTATGTTPQQGGQQ
ncbi:DUF3105 domain-containing protein [Actinoplanes flavus]|uniref:DUF3105 domain-containing protein n=1 Tax=Actinoplanes flavus TaxID=2820290 RepID=A0ABS3UCR8_9ACTN|nr:DUF3105 domain-containing protein [Actinoplanes flavus]MBO3736572.1 DUF3105 domain-containing protein [Actinoplanes flavus]